jgi:hypothetical protein
MIRKKTIKTHNQTKSFTKKTSTYINTSEIRIEVIYGA